MVVNFILIIVITYVRNALQSNHIPHDNKHVKHAIPFPHLFFSYFLCKIELTSKHKLVQTALSLNVYERSEEHAYARCYIPVTVHRIP